MLNEISLLQFICKGHVIIWKAILNLGLEVRSNEVVWSSVLAVLWLRRLSAKSCFLRGRFVENMVCWGYYSILGYSCVVRFVCGRYCA
jgi:hypothetical protein